MAGKLDGSTEVCYFIVQKELIFYVRYYILFSSVVSIIKYQPQQKKITIPEFNQYQPGLMNVHRKNNNVMLEIPKLNNTKRNVFSMDD